MPSQLHCKGDWWKSLSLSHSIGNVHKSSSSMTSRSLVPFLLVCGTPSWGGVNYHGGESYLHLCNLCELLVNAHAPRNDRVWICVRTGKCCKEWCSSTLFVVGNFKDIWGSVVRALIVYGQWWSHACAIYLERPRSAACENSWGTLRPSTLAR